MSHKLFIALFAIDLETSHKVTRKSLYLDVLKHTSKSPSQNKSQTGK